MKEKIRITWELPILDLAALIISLISLMVSVYVTFHVSQIHGHVVALRGMAYKQDDATNDENMQNTNRDTGKNRSSSKSVNLL